MSVAELSDVGARAKRMRKIIERLTADQFHDQRAAEIEQLLVAFASGLPLPELAQMEPWGDLPRCGCTTTGDGTRVTCAEHTDSVDNERPKAMKRCPACNIPGPRKTPGAGLSAEQCERCGGDGRCHDGDAFEECVDCCGAGYYPCTECDGEGWAW